MPQVNLLKHMNLVWEQHIMWTRMLLISIADNLGDLDATRTRLLENPKDIADIRAYDLVQKEILAMSQFFVNGIVRQFPELFY